MQEISLFNIVVSLLILVFGFLLNRVFSEIDKLNAHVTNIHKILPQDYIGKPDFNRHSDQEMKMIGELKADMDKHFDRLYGLIDDIRKQ